MGELILTVKPPCQELAELLEAANEKNPEPGAVAALRQYLDDHPQLWEVAGDLSRMAQDSLLEGLIGKQQAVQLSIKKGLEVKRDELGYGFAPPLERSLIDHVLTCWLHLQDVELRYNNAMRGSIAIAQAQWWERRLSATQRRYLRACETLARVRRLVRSTVQVNIAAEGGQQVNIAGDVQVGKQE